MTRDFQGTLTRFSSTEGVAELESRLRSAARRGSTKDCGSAEANGNAGDLCSTGGRGSAEGLCSAGDLDDAAWPWQRYRPSQCWMEDLAVVETVTVLWGHGDTEGRDRAVGIGGAGSHDSGGGHDST